MLVFSNMDGNKFGFLNRIYKIWGKNVSENIPEGVHICIKEAVFLTRLHQQ